MIREEILFYRNNFVPSVFVLNDYVKWLGKQELLEKICVKWFVRKILEELWEKFMFCLRVLPSDGKRKKTCVNWLEKRKKWRVEPSNWNFFLKESFQVIGWKSLMKGYFKRLKKQKFFFLFLGKNLLIEELMPSVRIGKRDFCCWIKIKKLGFRVA